MAGELSRRRWLIGGAACLGLWSSKPSARAADVAGPSFSPYDFGAVGDGIADDAAACNAASEHARTHSGELVFPPGVFAVSRYIEVHAGVRRVLGAGGVIKCVNTSSDAGVMLNAIGTARGGAGCEVRGLVIDCNLRESASTNGILLNDCSACVVRFNHVFNLLRGYGVLVRSSRRPAWGNEIVENLIEAPQRDTPTCSGIAVFGSTSFELQARAYDVWRRQFFVPEPLYPALHTTVSRNTIMGGYYGIALSGASDGVIRENVIHRNIRNISAQHHSDRNQVIDNSCSDSVSSAIHLAYGSKENRIAGNRVVTGRAQGEGLLQAYVGTRDNVFEDNQTAAIGSALPKYHVYLGVHADRNLILRNRLGGACSRAYIAVESGLSSDFKVPSHRNFGLGRESDFFSRRGMSGVVLDRNTVDASSDVPCVFLGQVSDERGRYSISRCVITRNVFVGSGRGPCLSLAESTPGLISNLTFSHNRSVGGSPRVVVAPRGTSHFAELRDNDGCIVRRSPDV